MKTDHILITGTLQRLVFVQAQKVGELYKDEKIILAADDYIDTNIKYSLFPN